MFYSFRNSTKIAVYKQVVRKKGTAINNYCTYSTPLFFWDYLNSLNKVLVIICNLMTISIDIFIILSIKLNMIDSLTGRASFPNHPRAFLCKSKFQTISFLVQKISFTTILIYNFELASSQGVFSSRHEPPVLTGDIRILESDTDVVTICKPASVPVSLSFSYP
jgi:hypothetical protein